MRECDQMLDSRFKPGRILELAEAVQWSDSSLFDSSLLESRGYATRNIREFVRLCRELKREGGISATDEVSYCREAWNTR
jgi:hypothetical protein